MNTRKIVPITLTCLLAACGSGDDGNPNADNGNPSANIAVNGSPSANIGVISFKTSRAGMSGGFIPDINGDGKKELLVGAPEAKTSTRKPGVANIYLSNANGIDEKSSLTLVGEGNGDFFGFSFANLGDVNGDDIADFAIGAINAEGNAGMSGAAYVFEGGTNPPKLLAKLKGLNAFDKFGFALGSGDINGDGLDDVIVSSPYTFTEDFQSGAVHIYFGGDSLANAPDVLIKGDKVNASVGFAVDAGDVNGDNIDDLIMDGHSKVFVYYGGTDFKSRIENDATPSVNIRSDSGGHGGSGFGYAVAYAGDVNGDGFGDIAVGNKRRSSPSTYDNAGSFYIFKGGDNLPAEFFENNTDYRLIKIASKQNDDHFASTIKMIGDVNDGGKPDFLVAADWANGGSDGKKLITGNIYLLYGENLTTDTPADDQPMTLATHAYPGSDSSAEYGSAMDIDGHRIFSGTPGANKHDGGFALTWLHDGSDVVTSESTTTSGSDPHAGH